MKTTHKSFIHTLYFTLLLLFSSTLSAASYSCNGENVTNVNGATTDATQSYSENSTDKNGARYFQFTTQADGEITISFDANQNQRMRIGSSCNDDDIYNPSDSSKKSDSTTFDVITGVTYYAYIQERNSANKLNFDVEFDFKADAVQSGCDSSLDTSANDSSSGVVIPSMNNISSDTTACIRGSSKDDDEDYYKFTVNSAGTLKVKGTSLNSSQYYLELGWESNKDGYYDERDSTHDVDDISLNAGDTLYVSVKESGSGTDYYEIDFEFIAGSAVVVTGCDDSLDTSANDDEPGTTITALDGATSSVTTCLSGASDDDDTDYYNFTVGGSGTLNITTSSPNDEKNHFQIKSSLEGTIHDYDTDKDRTLSFEVTKGETITFLFKETGSENDLWQMNLEYIVPQVPPIVEPIPDTTAAKDALFSLDLTSYVTLTNNDPITGYILSGSIPAGLSFHASTGILSGTPTNLGDSILALSANDDDGLSNKESFTLRISDATIIENGDDLCYEEITSSGMFCVDIGICSGGIGCQNTIPLTNKGAGTLTDVVVYQDETSLGGSFGSNCGVNPSGTCTQESDINLGPYIGMLGKTSEFNITNAIPAGDSSNSIWAKEFMAGSCFGKETLYTTYIKDGNTYRGELKPCSFGSCSNLSEGDRDFTIRNPQETRNITGNYAIGGNMNLCTDKNDNGDCSDDAFTTSNGYKSIYVDIDGDDTTVNSSSFDLDIPANSEVVWAGLYWQGILHRSDNADTKYNEDPDDEDFGRDGLWTSDNKILNATDLDSGYEQIDLAADNDGHGAYQACIVKFKVPDGVYVDVEADQLDYSNLGYGGFADVTRYINPTSPNGTYYVADIKSQTGIERAHGNYGAWSLVVIYKNSLESYRNITLFDGFVTVDSGYKGELLMSGFLTPKTSPVESRLAFFTLDGDGGPNSLYVDDTEIEDPDNSGDLFNSTIEPTFTRNPAYPSARVDLDIIELTDVLAPSQYEATLKPRSNGDRYTASYFIMSAELREIKMCYDYTYGQNGRFITAPSINDPKIDETFSSSDPIDIKLYFSNNENSDVTIKNLEVDIYPIDTNIVTYDRDSTYVTRPNENFTAVPDSGRDVADNYNKNIEIGDVGSLESFYVYYSLNHPTSNDINTSIKALVTFDLTISIDGIDVDLGGSTVDMADMDPCESTLQYSPVPGMFNIVHDNYQNGALSSNYYYNLPTQVVNRTGNYSVEAMDPDNLDTVQGVASLVAVEMVDVSGFHYATATCTDENATTVSSNKVWAIFDTESTTLVPLNKSDMENASFFSEAIRNAAFRLSYNIVGENDALVEIEKNGANYKILNFTDLVQDIGSCMEPVQHPSNANQTTNNVSVACGNAGNQGISAEHLKICSECLYGYNTKRLCSRDNFSIRPEALSINLFDQNKSDASKNIFVLNNMRNLDESFPTTVDIAAGYEYRVDINSTDHYNAMPTIGYSATDLNMSLNWIEPIAVVCTDESSLENNLSTNNGSVVINQTINQVGQYNLKLEDRTWTEVDSNPDFMSHHQGSYFKAATVADCIEDSTAAQTSSTVTPLNGCVIGSKHTNIEPGYTKKYYDVNLTTHPYKFDISTITPTLGLFDKKVTGPNPFVYMADLSDEQKTSLHLDGNIIARGFNDTQLSNFVAGCYAQAVDVNISRTDTNGSVAFQYRLNDAPKVDINNSTNPIMMPASDFITTGDSNGSLATTLNLNFDRKKDSAQNPESLTFASYNVECTNEANCTFIADTDGFNIITKTTEGKKAINETISFYYGRTHAPRQTFVEAASPSNKNAFIYYEVYCSGAGCNKTLLQSGTNSIYTDDPRWWVNPNHTSNFGSAGKNSNIVEKRKPSNISITTQPTGKHQDRAVIKYNGSKGYPYKTTMEDNASSWLIYNKYNADADVVNEFQVEFINEASKWAGQYETDTTTKTTGSTRTNRRSMW